MFIFMKSFGFLNASCGAFGSSIWCHTLSLGSSDTFKRIQNIPTSSRKRQHLISPFGLARHVALSSGQNGLNRF